MFPSRKEIDEVHRVRQTASFDGSIVPSCYWVFVNLMALAITPMDHLALC